jgi:S1-C subfamily serine protease
MTAPRYAQGLAAAPVTAVLPEPDWRPSWDGHHVDGHDADGHDVDGRGWDGHDWDGGYPPPPRPPQWNGAPPRRSRFTVLRWVVGGALLIVLAWGAGVAAFVAVPALHAADPPAPRATAPARQQDRPLPPLTDDSALPEPSATATASAPPDPAAVIANLNKSIVNITSTLGLRNARAAGTGVVLTGTGLVVTNNHVIAGATAISGVAVANGRTFTATVVGYDRSHDIAVIQLTGASGLPRLTVADSSLVKVGDPVIAAGNAGGQGGTPKPVTGKVTGLNKTITAKEPDGGGSQRLDGLIEVAANIESGDSGGPLVDANGRLIGINTAASFDENQAAAGTGYAVPSNTAFAIARQIQQGQASNTVHLGQTALLGVSAADNDNPKGAKVSGLLDNGPARQAGLTNGDVIRSVDGKTVDSAKSLTTILDAHHPGDEVQVVWTDRAGRNRQAAVSLAVGPAG